MSAGHALSRTMLLMRTELRPETPDEALLDALLQTEVGLVADHRNLASAEGQQALVTAAALIARSGGQCYVEAPDVPPQGVTAPLRGDGVVGALLDFGADLVPGRRIIPGLPRHSVDIAVVIGDSPWRGKAQQAVYLSGNAWTGRVGAGGDRWTSHASPFGALSAAGLAAGEAYKAAMRRLRSWARNPGLFDDYFRPVVTAEVALAPPGTAPPPRELGRFDLISGGAITQALLYALCRIPGAEAEARVIEPERSDMTNINRYAFLRRSLVGMAKAEHLASLDLCGVTVAPLPVRYEDRNLQCIGSLAPRVLVGVDHVPSRWAVQRARPHWLGIGASGDYMVMVSFHTAGLPCARCLHPDGAGTADRIIPTAAFVSHWAGLWLASLFARTVLGKEIDSDQQQIQMATLRPDSPTSIWRTPGVALKGCSIGCPL